MLSSNDSVLSVDMDIGDFIRKLATKATHTALTVIVNFLMVHKLSVGMYPAIGAIFKHSNVLYTPGMYDMNREYIAHHV